MSRPKPGSLEATQQGCVCPSPENNGGLLAPFPPDGWWVDGACPVHGPFVTEQDIDTAEVAAAEDLPLDKGQRA